MAKFLISTCVMRLVILLLLVMVGCQQTEQPSTDTTRTKNTEEDDGQPRSDVSSDDVDPSYLRQLPLLTLPWVITKETFGCNLYETPEEIGVLGDTSKYFIIVSVRTFNPGTQQLKFSTYDKEGTWLIENNRLEFCVALVETDEPVSDRTDCPLKFESDFSIQVTEDLHIRYLENQVQNSCEGYIKDSFVGKGAIVEGEVTDFSIKASTEVDTTSMRN